MWHPRMGSSLFWYDNWTGLRALYFLVPQDFGVDESVHNAWEVVDREGWDAERLVELLPEEFVEHILQNIKPPTAQRVLDVPCWMLEPRGYFSVKTAWDYLRRRAEPMNAFKMIWVNGLPFKIAFFMWKVWRNKLPLDDFFRRLGYLMASKCWCCAEPKEETTRHLFFTSYAANKVWKYYLGHAGIAVEGLTLHQVIVKCWTADVVPRLKPIMQALPSVIVWELWKRRNSYKYGDAVTINTVVYQISNTLHSLIKVRKPGVQQVPHRSSIGFVLRNEEGDVLYACGKEIHEGSNSVAEAKAIYEVMQYCVQQDYVLIDLHTDSMLLKKAITGEWKPPWVIETMVEEIRQLMN
ncbi:PREDICTED: uncharacterized protein LOC109209485 [Nicotiana attenuata]|uniref:uncharacterized protein LOC109209485 n=1 Tax=Nicotiana attenuata TaxID=49451 RepID=UPI000905B128|nr:PREDICTED: uncharacterized protein LOC109209485 [Nicotiana attenuata]